MQPVEIEQPHGWLEDGDGRVCLRFGNWTPGEHAVPDYVASVHYCDGPNAHPEPLADAYREE